MKLCMGIIEDALGRPAEFKNYTKNDMSFNLERCEIYCGQSFLSSGILYVAKVDTLLEYLSVLNDSAMICIGMPSEMYTKSPLRLLVVNADFKLDELINKISAIFSEYNTLEYKLLEAVSKGWSVQYMVDLMAPYFNQNELLVNTNEFRFIGISNKYSRLCQVSNIPQPDPEFLPQEVVTYFKNDIIWNNVKKLTEPFIYEPSIFSVSCLCMNIFHGGEFSCRVVVADDRNPYRYYDEGLLRFFSSFIQLVFDTPKHYDKIVPKDHAVDMFSELMHGGNVERWRLEGNLTQRGWNITGLFLCACIMPSERDYFNRTIPYYCQAFNHDFAGCCLFEFDGAIVCVVNLKYYNNAPDEFSSGYLETFRDANFRVGYSNPFEDIMELRSYYLQAKIALKTGLERFPSLWYHKFSDMVLFYLQTKMTEELGKRFLCAHEISMLSRYDNDNQSEYLRTLKVYLDNQMNAQKTAKDLFIHRMTMEYRLNRIKELTGIDFRNPDQTLYYMMSLRFFSDSAQENKKPDSDACDMQESASKPRVKKKTEPLSSSK